MKIPKAHSNPGVELHNPYLLTHQATKLYAHCALHSLHSYTVYSDIAFGWLIGFNTERGKEYFIRNK